MAEKYKVLVRGEEFILSRDQIEFDSPNYFTSCFLGDFTESQTHVLQLSRDPELFKIILDYLSGYRVLPLSESFVSRAGEYEKVVQNLLVDAKFYLLDGLVDQTKAYRETQKPTNPSLPSPYAMLSKRVQNDTWCPPMFISEDFANEMKKNFGVERILAVNWDRYEPPIRQRLQEAQLHNLFLVYALWEHPRQATHHVILKFAS